MDYSKFYHDWLQLDLAPEEVPNFYQILGVRNMEPDVQKIETAFQSTLDRLQSVNGMTNPEAYTAIMSRVLEAHKVFIDPNQKHAYDMQLSENTGERVWKGYERPSFLTRLRQMSLIAFSFLLGFGVVAVLALSAERNPDGSIVFREESQAHKALPFASQLDYVVYRPSIAQDYQPNGYTVAANKAAHKTESALADAPLETSEPNAEAQNTERPDSSAIAQNQSPQSEMEEFSQILSEKIPAPNRQEVAKVNRRSPLYNKTVALSDGSSENSKKQSGNKNDQESEIGSEIPAETPAPTLPQVASTVQESVFSLTSVIELLENVRSNLDFSKPDAAEAYTLLQYQTIHEILQKLCEVEGALEPEDVRKFAEYTLKVMTDLGWEKHFDEAYLLCDTMKKFSEKRDLADLLDEAVTQRRSAIQNYQTLYNSSRKVLERLQENPDDPELNTQYAMWLWQDTGEIEESIPYLAKSQYTVIRRAAISEMQLAQDESLNTPATTLKVADYWWDIASLLKNQRQVFLVKEHAKKLYRRVDSSFLSPDQKERVASL